MNKTVLKLIIFYVCIARTPDDSHFYQDPEMGVGHVSVGQGLYDNANAAVNACEQAHGKDQCELLCFLSREGGEL